MLKKVVYTSLVGKYDSLINPIYIMDGWDYICFSNDLKEVKDSIWKIRPIPYENKDNLRLSRFVKLNPHVVLIEYDVSLYMDANLVMINNSIEIIVNDLIKAEMLISIPKHPLRDCIYDEAKVCIQEGKDSHHLFFKQIEFLKNQNFPVEEGLFENNIIFRRHNDEQIIKLSDNWWKLYKMYSRRDQLSLVYLLWKFKINCIIFFKNGESAKEFSGVKYAEHNESLRSRIERSLRVRINNLFKK